MASTYIRHTSSPPLNSYIDHQQHGTLSIRELSDHIGISQSHLGTLFKRMVGTSPKELARLNRFVHVLRSIDHTHPIDWTQVALHFGYYDLSHQQRFCDVYRT